MTNQKPQAPADQAPAGTEGVPAETQTPAENKPAEAQAPDTITLSLDDLGKLVAAEVAKATAAANSELIAKLNEATEKATRPRTPFQAAPFDKGSNEPRVVMTLGDPEKGNVETKSVQERHAHIMELLGWTRQN